MGQQTADKQIILVSDETEADQSDMSDSAAAESAGGYAEVLRVATPLILSTASFTLMLFINRMMLSWHGQSSVAAATPGGITYFTICSFFLGTAEYVNTIVAQHHGAGDKRACARAVWHGVLFSVVSAPLILACIPLGNLLLTWGGHEPEVLLLEKEYFTILMAGGVALPLNAALSSFFSGRGKTKVVLWGNLIGNAANALLSYILIFGKLGLPAMGIRGAGLATAITGAVPALYWSMLFLSSRYQDSYATRMELKWDRHLFVMLLRYGLPSGVQFFLDVASFTIFVLLVGRLGEVALAASNIVLSIEMLSYLPMAGMSIATATLVGDYIGRRQHASAERSAYSALMLASAYSLLFAVLFLAAPRIFLDLFANGGSSGSFEGVEATGVILLRIVAIYTVFNNVFMVFCGALNGAGDTRFAMWTQIGLSWVFFVPSAYVVIEFLSLGVFAAWGAMLIYVVLLGLAFYLRFRSGYWKTIRMVERSGAASAG